MKRFLRGAGRVLLALVALLVSGTAALYGYTQYRMQQKHPAEERLAVAVTADPQLIQAGARLAKVRGCVDCHGEDLGGKTFLDVAPVGRVFASNLTAGRGGVGSAYSDVDLARAIRHGVRPDGEALLIMPSQEFQGLSDEDVAAMIAYIRSVPPVDNEPFEPSVGPVGRFLYLTGQAPLLPAELIDHAAPRPAAPAPGPTAEYGAYLATGCIGCHGNHYSGGKIPGMPPEFPAASNLTMDLETGLGTWTEEHFFAALRTGRRPDGSELRPEMPWKLTAAMTDDEIRALWLYLQTVERREFGNR